MRWAISTLSEVCKIDRSIHKAKLIPYVGMEDIESNTGKLLGGPEVKSVKSNTFSFDERHVLYGRLRPYLNKVLLPDFAGHCSTEIMPFLPSSQVDRRYLFYWLTSSPVVAAIDATCTGARMPRANMDAVSQFKIPLPPLPEQRRIVAILDEAFAGLEVMRANAEKNLNNAREIFGSVLDANFSGGMNGWTEAALENVVSENCSLSYGIVQPGEPYDAGLAVVRPTDLGDKYVSLANLKRIDPGRASGYERTKLEGNELLLCVRGSTGVLSVATSELAGGNVTRGIVPVKFDPKRILQEFGYFLMRSPAVQNQIKAKTYGAALMQINIRDLRLIRVLVPPLTLQKIIIEKLRLLEESTERLEANYFQKLTAIDELKQSLLHRAFSGELTSKASLAA